MMWKMNRGISLLVLLLILLSGPSFAVDDSIGFDDVPADSWFYEGVMTMVEHGVITGYPNGKFLPHNEVSREEFAVMMVRALQLGKSGSDSSFVDVEDDYWAVPYIESAKQYLTGYKTNQGIAFKAKNHAVREDMAVALVKALGYDVKNTNLDILNNFKDKHLISENLKPYVAMAYEKKLIKGAEENDGLYFNPTKTLSRAESAVLLLAVIEEEKITFEEEKVVFENGYLPTNLSIEVEEDAAYLKWDMIKHDDFEGYKVVVSRFDSTPSYPDNGALRFFEDNDVTLFDIRSGQKASGTDFSEIQVGERYYVTITVLYKEGKKTSNTVSFVLEEESEEAFVRPSLQIETSDDDVELFWTKVTHSDFKYYKVVVSETDSSPKYPENGYMRSISNPADNKIKLETGDRGEDTDFDYLEANQKYYVAISAVYEDRTLTSNVVEMVLGEDNETSGGYITPQLIIKSDDDDDDDIELEWTEIKHPDFEGYKVVVSKNDSTPKYPDNGYVTYITYPDQDSFKLRIGTKATNADFSEIIEGEMYYVAVTALYKDEKRTSNVETFKLVDMDDDSGVSDDDHDGAFIAPRLEIDDISAASIRIEWDDIEHDMLDGYKVVVSEKNSTPKYPEDGYMVYITDLDIDEYTLRLGDYPAEGDFIRIEENVTYYVTITAVYGDERLTSNSISFSLGQ